MKRSDYQRSEVRAAVLNSFDGCSSCSADEGEPVCRGSAEKVELGAYWTRKRGFFLLCRRCAAKQIPDYDPATHSISE